MDQVINGIEAQKQEDQSILSKPVSGPDGQDYPHARPRWCNTHPPQSLTITTGKDFNQVSLCDTHQTSGKRWIHNVGESISLFVANSQQKIKTSIKLLAAKGDVLIQAQSNDVEITADKKINITACKNTLTARAGKEFLIHEPPPITQTLPCPTKYFL